MLAVCALANRHASVAQPIALVKARRCRRGVDEALTVKAGIAGLIARYRMPIVADGRNFAEAGVLLTYATNTSERWSRTAQCVRKIVNGANPADLAVELVSHYEFIINLATAKTSGLKVPPSLLARASRVIE